MIANKVSYIKRCPKCGEDKSVELFGFFKNRAGKAIAQSWCTECRRIANHATYEKYKEKRRANARVSAKKRRTENAEHHYALKKAWIAKHREQVNAWGKARRFKRPIRYKAAYVLSNAVKLGKLPPARNLICCQCGAQAEQYHHWSYAPEHWLDVIPVCVKCHREIHKQLREQAKVQP